MLKLAIIVAVRNYIVLSDTVWLVRHERILT
jgi:hypothetical protein